MRRPVCLFALSSVLATLAAVLSGCGGSGNGGAPLGGSGGATDRAAVMQAAGDKWDSISKTDLGAATTQMVDWLKTQPGVADEGVTNDLMVWATLQDGTTIGWLDDSYLNGQGRSAPLPLPPTRSSRAIPAGKTAYLFQCDLFTIDPSRTGADIRPQLAAMLEKAGYTVVRKTGTLADFAAINPADCALLWTNSHGTILPVKVGGAKQTHYFMASSTTANQSDDKPGGTYYEDLHNGRMVALKNPGQPYYYWFAGSWLQNNVHFQEGGHTVWINNACEGATTREMSDAAFHQGLSVYTGWDESVLWHVANNSALYLVDRMAGTNLQNPVPEPPQRPFQAGDIVVDMGKQSPSLTVSSIDVPWFFKYLPPPYNQAHGVTAHLQLLTNPFAGQSTDEQFTLLNPSIAYMDVDATGDNQLTLSIHGVFGPRAGKVTIDGTEVPLTGGGWKSSTIQCLLPPGEAPGASGDVVVEVDGRKSNAVQLTMWKVTIHSVNEATLSGTVVIEPAGTFTKEVDGDLSGSTTNSADLVVWIRADIHDYHSSPGQNPLTKPRGDFVVTRNARKTKDAKVPTWNISGKVETDLHYKGEAPYDHTTDTYSTGQGAPIVFDGSDPRGRPSSIGGNIDVDAHTMNLFAFMTADTPGKVHHVSEKFGDGGIQNGGGGASFNPDNTSAGPVPLKITLGSDFSIQSGSYSETYSDPSAGISGERTFSWSGTVSNPPDPNATRAAPTRATSRAR